MKMKLNSSVISTFFFGFLLIFFFSGFIGKLLHAIPLVKFEKKGKCRF